MENTKLIKGILLFVKVVIGTVMVGLLLVMGAETKQPKYVIFILTGAILLYIVQWISKKLLSNKE